MNFVEGLFPRLAGALLCAASFGGCLFASSPSEPLDIFPLAAGNTWTYVDSVNYGNDSIGVSSSETSIVGIRQILVDGKPQTVFLSNSHAPGGPASAFSAYVANVGHSNYNFGGEQDTAQIVDRILHLEYPTHQGRQYATRFYGFRSEGYAWLPVFDTIRIEVLDAHHNCKVPAGQFTCVQYRGYRTDGSVYATAYHAPGIRIPRL